MRAADRIVLLAIFWSVVSFTFGQTVSHDRSVRARAVVSTNPPSITLIWLPHSNTTGFTVQRKLEGASSWGSVIASLPGTATQYVDNAVQAGVSYEYRIVRNTANLGQGFAYINAGIGMPMVEDRGTLVLLVDNTFTTSLATQLTQLQEDFEGDGWKVVRFDVSRTAPVASVKAHVVSTYNAAPAQVKAVFIVGHVPVPYSGNLAPDGHGDHYGAWPADVYYGDVNGSWSDNSVWSTGSQDPRNHNVPGDGKFDQSTIPSTVELAVGRIDFANMPAFSQSETTLLANYLTKLHQWKHKQFTAQYRAVVDDNFTGYADAFAQNAWRGFSPLVDPANVNAGDYFNSLSSGTYVWSYGCGGGWWTGSNGIGTTANFTTSNLQSVFTILFGSYFGDWDCTNNFMRASLAQGRTLTNFWAGYPNWYVHHMGLGAPIGKGVITTQNNGGGHYNPANWQAGRVHIALLGDPTLRMHIVAPPGAVNASVLNSTSASISWGASPDAGLGYHVFRYNAQSGTWVRRTTSPVTGTSFTDNISGLSGQVRYMVRALKLEVTPSGSYHNLSQGRFATLNVNGPVLDCQGVPGGPAVPGSSCDDGNANTVNDTWTANCQCEGDPLDCLGVPNGAALPGSPCNDGDPDTGNDTWDSSCNCSGLPLDCAGSPGGSALPGTPCNDGDPGTGNDTWTVNCQCLGQPVDCAGVPNGTALPGTPCDDGDPGTGNDIYASDCTCAGQPIDCLGVPGGSAVLDDCGVCNGTNDCLNGAVTVCTTVALSPDGDVEEAENGNMYATTGPLDLVFDSEPVPWRGEQTIGLRFTGVEVPPGAVVVNARVQFTASGGANIDPCQLSIGVEDTDDASPIGWAPYALSSRQLVGTLPWLPAAWTQANVAGPDQRTPDLSSLVQQVVSRPGWQSNNAMLFVVSGSGGRTAWQGNDDPAKAASLCISYLPDSTVLFDCEGQLGGSAFPGSPCDDGDPLTLGDVYGSDCTCSGLLIDCQGQQGGTALPGTPCDDGDIATVNDVWTSDCQCVGQLVDCNGVPGGTALPGSPCDDGDPLTQGDTWDASCACQGVPVDCSGTVGGSALPGTPCDDGDPGTADDTWDSDCNCTGLIIDCNGVPGGGAVVDLCGVCGGNNDCVDGTSCVRVSGTAGDAEQAMNGNIYMNAGALDLVFDSETPPWRGDQLVGLHFQGVEVPPGAEIVSASIQFTSSGTENLGPCVLNITAELSGDAATIGWVPFDLSGRSRTDSVGWTMPEWLVVDAADSDQRTPDLSALVQEVVDLPDWQSNNAMLFLLQGTGRRMAYSWDQDPLKAAELCISYTLPPPVIDCEGVLNGPSLPGSPCDDGDPGTGDDTWTSDCNCVGLPIDCAGVPGGMAFPGTPCDDGLALTINDQWDVDCTCAGIPVDVDCEGVLNGPALPGTPCDDGDAGTVSDTWTSGCTCVGVVVDCEGVAGGPALPGSPCDDGDPDTGGDSWTVDCLCEGLPFDCAGVPGGNSLPGTPCDDGDPDTGDDAWDANCNCLGALIDCEGLAGGTSLPGTPCDDGDPGTAGDVWDAGCNCVGASIDCAGVIGGGALPGTPCDDGNVNTGNDTWDANCDCLGQLIDCAGVVGGGALPGTPCDDGDPMTGNDTWDTGCSCAGEVMDCDGVVGGTALPGTPCDDGDPDTGNDTWDTGCNCIGQVFDCAGVPGGIALPGAPCDDGDPDTGNDTWTANCDCIGEVYDCAGVPGGPSLPGTPCDDGDPGTADDSWTANCDCAGLEVDCDGVPGGSAFIDDCGTCAGGTTGIDPNPDVDGDAVLDCFDNCPGTWNPDQLDSDGDGVGDVCDDDVGILEHQGIPWFMVHPNPSSGLVRLDMADPAAQRAIMHDLAGAVVLDHAFRPVLDLGHLAQGTYVLTILDAQGTPLARARVVRY